MIKLVTSMSMCREFVITARLLAKYPPTGRIFQNDDLASHETWWFDHVKSAYIFDLRFDILIGGRTNSSYKVASHPMKHHIIPQNVGTLSIRKGIS